jgi:hypothetical protein
MKSLTLLVSRARVGCHIRSCRSTKSSNVVETPEADRSAQREIRQFALNLAFAAKINELRRHAEVLSK